MAVSHVNTTSDSVNGTSKAVAVPSGVQVDDFLILSASKAPASTFGTVTDPAGWNRFHNMTPQQFVWWKWADSTDAAGGATHTPSWVTTGNVALFMSAFRGVDKTNPFIGFRVRINDGTIGTTCRWRSLFCLPASDFMAYVVGSYGRGGVTLSIGNSYTQAGTIDAGGAGNNTSTRSSAAYRSFTATAVVADSLFTASSSTSAGPGATFHILLQGIGYDLGGLRAANERMININGVTSVTPAIPDGTKTGDLLFVVVGTDEGASNHTMTMAAGWTELGSGGRSVASGRETHATYARYAAGMSTLHQWSGTPANIIYGMVAIAKAVPVGTVSGTNDGSNNTTIDFGALTVPAQPMFCFVGGTPVGNRTHTAPSGYNEIFQLGQSFPGGVSTSLHLRYQETADPAGGTIGIDSAANGAGSIHWAAGLVRNAFGLYVTA